MDADRAHELLAGERRRIEQALGRLRHQDDGEPADELDQGLAEDLRRQLAAVERAEQRLAAGSYGLSVESGRPIPDERLEAVPTAELTIEEERARTRT
jgi:RNA polymerase-binding transcription factor